MNFTNKFTFDWGSNDGSEPSAQLKQSGFSGGYKPSAGVFNWFWRKVIKCTTELQTAVTTVEESIPTNTSELTNDSGYITSADVPANVPIVNNLNSTLTTSALSANQGRVLNTALSGKSSISHTHSYGDILGLAGVLSGKSDTSHTHTTASIVSDGFMSSADKTKLNSVLAGATPVGQSYDSAGEIFNCYSGENANVSTGSHSHAEGRKTSTVGACAHAEGYYTTANGFASHAEGEHTTADYMYAHAEGYYTTAGGRYSHASGSYTIAGDYQFALGHYNAANSHAVNYSQSADDTLFMIGNGISNSSRSNALRTTADGQTRGLKAFLASGADFAEYFEWSDGNPENEDRRGRIVTLDGEKIRLATSIDDYVLGVVSGAGAFIGNTSSENWQGRYLKDVFGENIMEDVEIPESTDEITGEVKPAHTVRQFAINPDYDPEQEYVSREFRKEWSPVGILGQVVVVDDGTCTVSGFCSPSTNGIGTSAESGYKVMSRIDSTHIKVLVK